MIYIFTGNGKGKTTAALGVGMRAVGAQKKVLLIRFFKEKGISSEERAIEKIKNFYIKSFGRKGFFLPISELKKNPELKKIGVKPLTEKDEELFRKGFRLAKEEATSKKYHLLILDEIILGVRFGIIKKEELIEFLRKHKKKIDIILTGRDYSKEIMEVVDLVTEMKEVKHYFRKSQKAKRGVDF